MLTHGGSDSATNKCICGRIGNPGPFEAAPAAHIAARCCSNASRISFLVSSSVNPGRDIDRRMPRNRYLTPLRRMHKLTVAPIRLLDHPSVAFEQLQDVAYLHESTDRDYFTDIVVVILTSAPGEIPSDCVVPPILLATPSYASATSAFPGATASGTVAFICHPPGKPQPRPE
jgi:hypothetical protein